MQANLQGWIKIMAFTSYSVLCEAQIVFACLSKCFFRSVIQNSLSNDMWKHLAIKLINVEGNFIVSTRTHWGEPQPLVPCHFWGVAPIRFPVPSPDSGPRSFPWVPQYLFPCPFEGGTPGLGYPLSQDWCTLHLAMTGVHPSQDWCTLHLARTGVVPGQDWCTPPGTGYAAGGTVSCRRLSCF